MKKICEKYLILVTLVPNTNCSHNQSNSSPKKNLDNLIQQKKDELFQSGTNLIKSDKVNSSVSLPTSGIILFSLIILVTIVYCIFQYLFYKKLKKINKSHENSQNSQQTIRIIKKNIIISI